MGADRCPLQKVFVEICGWMYISGLCGLSEIRGDGIVVCVGDDDKRAGRAKDDRIE